MERKPYKLNLFIPDPLLDSLQELQRVRGRAVTSEMIAKNPVRTKAVPAMSEVIRQLIEEAHTREVKNK